MKLQKKYQAESEWQACSELVALQRASHPFIVRLEQAFQTPTLFALLLELCPDGNLNELLWTRGREKGLPPHFAATYAGHVMLALHHLHERLKIAHRDLKPVNILLSSDEMGSPKRQGQRFQGTSRPGGPEDKPWPTAAKLSDFGFAAYVNQHHHRCFMTQQGTFGFMAPELFEGDDFCSPQSSRTMDSNYAGVNAIYADPFKLDAFSYGATLLVMLTGKASAEGMDDLVSGFTSLGVPTRADTRESFFSGFSGSNDPEQVQQLVPREVSDACVAALVQRNMLDAHAGNLLGMLVKKQPQRRAFLTDPEVREHTFFLENCDIESLSDLLPDGKRC